MPDRMQVAAKQELPSQDGSPQDGSPQDGSPQALFSRGIAALRKDQAAEAIEHFKKASAVRRGQPLYHLKLGRAYQAAGKLEEAADAYETCVRLKPELWSAQFSLGLIRLGLGDRARAWPSLRLGLRLAAADLGQSVVLWPVVLALWGFCLVRHGPGGRPVVRSRVRYYLGRLLEARGDREVPRGASA